MTGAQRRRHPGALLLAHGAGADCTHHTLVAVDDAVVESHRIPTRRFDFPYRAAGKKAPDRAPVAMAAVVDEAASLVAEAGCRANRLVLGGRSFGGRMCSMAVANGLPAAGLVLLSYPLHPPGKPDRLRIEHFPELFVPVLFIGGDADPFGTKAEFKKAVRAIPGPVTMVWMNGGHDPRGVDEMIAMAVLEWIENLPIVGR